MTRSIKSSSVMVPILLLLASAAHAQTSSSPAACAALLTSAEVAKAVGVAMKDMGSRVQPSGESLCPWMAQGGTGGFKTVSVQFYDLNGIQSGPFKTSPAFFEEIVQGAEGMASGNKRQKLAGIGQQAILLAADPQVIAVVQRPDGVARIVGNNLTKAQMTEVARAVATP